MSVPRGVPHVSARFCTFLHVSAPFGVDMRWWYGWMYCCCIAAGGTWSKNLIWGTHSPWWKFPPLNLEFWLFTHNSLVFNNSHWYQYQAIGNLHEDSVGTWGCVWDSQTRNKCFLPLWAWSEFTWIDTGTNRNHKTKEFAKKAVKTWKETNKWLQDEIYCKL